MIIRRLDEGLTLRIFSQSLKRVKKGWTARTAKRWGLSRGRGEAALRRFWTDAVGSVEDDQMSNRMSAAQPL